jgi:hypothetical protein
MRLAPSSGPVALGRKAGRRRRIRTFGLEAQTVNRRVSTGAKLIEVGDHEERLRALELAFGQKGDDRLLPRLERRRGSGR